MRAMLGISVSLLVAAAGVFSFSDRETSPLGPHRIPVDNMNLTSIERTDSGIVAAGELGHILVSSDNGKSWTRAELSHHRHALITRTRFRDGLNGLAIGHEGWILRTEDGGNSWQETHFEPGTEPLLGLGMLADRQWMAVGAFGLTLVSNDDGISWSEPSRPLDTDWHLNALIPSRDGTTWLLAGESGTLFRSTDSGNSWESIPEFYNGSLYGGINIDDETWVVYGMRGNIFRSDDNGLNWEQVANPIPASVFSHTQLADGRLILAGQGGLLLLSDDGGRHFRPVFRGGRMSLTDIEQLDSGKLLISSDSGMIPVLTIDQITSQPGA
jgi:photosystem II stability/assembly factor-like uncharacterized protein